MLRHYLAWTLLGIASAGAFYAISAALIAGRRFSSRMPASLAPQPPVTMLRPLRGAESGLFEALASTVRQDYCGPIQLICGIQNEADPARAVMGALQAGFPERNIVLVCDHRQHGCNPKISNIINILAHAEHDILVLSDGDIAAPPTWLSSVVSSLNEPAMGAVSCFYVGTGPGVWSRLAAMGISYQFLPNAVFGTATTLAHPCFGSTIALRRQVLAEIGGFDAFRDTLADDYEIGHAVRARGYTLAYPPILVRHMCTERSLAELWRHELRWARTIRTVDPLGHFGSVLTHAFPLGLIGAGLAGFSPGALIVLATVLLARLFLKSRIDHIAGVRTGPAWLLPLRDVLSFGVFLASLAGRKVHWRGERLNIGARGAIS